MNNAIYGYILLFIKWFKELYMDSGLISSCPNEILAFETQPIFQSID